MVYSAIGHSILVLAILAHLFAGSRLLGVGLGLMALVIAWLIESAALTKASWALQWVVIILTAAAWGLFFYSVI